MSTTTPAPESKKSILAIVIPFLFANWSYIALVLGGVGGIFVATNYFKDKQTISEMHKLQTWTDSVSNSKIKYYTDVLGKEHARVENLAIHDAAMQSYADSIARALKVKADRVSTVANTEGNAHVSVVPIVDSPIYVKIPCKGDSVEVAQTFLFHYNDSYAQITGKVGIGAVNNITVDIPDTLRRVDYWSRKWFLGSKTYYSDLTNTNPYVHVTGYKGVTLAGVTDQEKRWSIGPTIAVGYGPGAALGKPSFFVGVGLTYSIKKF